MVRAIVQLTESQAKELRERAREQGISVSELVRRGVDLVLRTGITNAEVRKRAKAAVGFIKDVPDLSVNHDKYLAEVNAERQSE
ncbi:MAG: ribbon-helix-helix domain-containing protein [Armatimonadetes bacterium]|nr:ribbon-helix-helix domain-containing protein [Armatimonadota bacterium]